MPLTSYAVDEDGRGAAAPRARRGAQRDQHRRCSRRCSPTWPRPARTTPVAGAGDLLQRPPRASRPAPTSARSSTRRAGSAACSCSPTSTTSSPPSPSRRSPPATASVVGGGAEIAIACDLRVGGANLRLSFPGAELGVPVGPARLVTLCGLSTAKYLLLTSRNVSADEALRMGLVHRVAPAARTEEAALELAAEVAAAPARVGRPAQADAPPLGRRRRALRRRGPRPGRVAALRPGPLPHRDVDGAGAPTRAALRSLASKSPGPCPDLARIRDPGRSSCPDRKADAHHAPEIRYSRSPPRTSACARSPTLRSGGAGPSRPTPRPRCAPTCWRRCSRTRSARGAARSLVVAADDRSARDLAADLRAFLAPRRVQPLPLAGDRLPVPRRPAAAPRGSAGGRPRRARSASPTAPPVVVASAIALAEAVPDPALRPRRPRPAQGRERRPRRRRRAARRRGLRADRAGRGARPVRDPRRHPRRLSRDRGAGGPRRAVRRRDRVDALVLDLHPALPGGGRAGRAAPAAELGAEHRDLPAELSARRRRRRESALTSRSCSRSIASGRRSTWSPSDALVAIAAAEEIPGALHDHWEDVTAAMHDDDARRLYVDVAEPLPERAALSPERRRRRAASTRFARSARSSPRAPSARREGELEKLIRSGYRTVVAFERPRRGRAGPLQPGSHRRPASSATSAPEEPGVSFAEAAPARRLPLARAEAGGDPLRAAWSTAAGPPRPPRPGRRHRRRDRAARRRPTSSTRTTASRASPASTPRRSPGVTRDYLRARVQGGDKVFAPTDQLAKISRYVGADGAEPAAEPAGRQALAEHEVARAQAPRRRWPASCSTSTPSARSEPGTPSPPDGEWQLAFEAAFPYRETADQMEAIDAVKADMEARAADGPPDLRRRRLRQDRGGAARRPQGRRRRQAGDDAGADHDPRPAALRHLPRALRRHPLQRRDGLAAAQARRGQGRAGAIRRRARWTS